MKEIRMNIVSTSRNGNRQKVAFGALLAACEGNISNFSKHCINDNANAIINIAFALTVDVNNQVLNIPKCYITENKSKQKIKKAGENQVCLPLQR